MKNEMTPDLDREIKKKLRRRWWKVPLLLSVTLMLTGILSSLVVGDWSHPSLFGILSIALGTTGFFTFIGFLFRLLNVSPVKNIIIDEVKHCIVVTYYNHHSENNVIMKENDTIPLSTNHLFYEPRQEGTMLRDRVITVPHPDDFAAWFTFIRDAEIKMKRESFHSLPVHRVLPPAPAPQLASKSAECRVCGRTMGLDLPLVMCSKCQTPHHEDCWIYSEKCSVFGCGEAKCQKI